MNNHSDQQRLLNDVLAESSPSDFRAALLHETLRVARHRRRWRQSRRAAGGLAVLFIGAWLAWCNWPEKISTVHVLAKAPMAINYRLVENQSFPMGATVMTGGFTGVKAISSEAAITQITSGSGHLRFINDAQLLALAGLGKAILVRTGPASEELVFAEPMDWPNGNRAN
jgi:hypothetical protein